MPYRAVRRPKPIEPVQRTALYRARTRREREAGLVEVCCWRCLAPLATVLPPAEVFCFTCRLLTPSALGAKRGVVG